MGRFKESSARKDSADCEETFSKVTVIKRSSLSKYKWSGKGSLLLSLLAPCCKLSTATKPCAASLANPALTCCHKEHSLLERGRSHLTPLIADSDVQPHRLGYQESAEQAAVH